MAARCPHRPGLVIDQHVDHAIGMLHAAGADLLGLEHAQAVASTMAGPPMPMLLARVAMITSLQPSSAALPAKQRPAAMPITGTCLDSAA